MVPSCFAGCYRTERDSLLDIKFHLADPSNRLADWVADGDCCNWTGVVCHNLTGHVLELHLRTLSFEEYFGPDQYYPDDFDYYDYIKKSAMGGKVSSSLLQLKHLRSLDLSNNDFGGVSIPSFFGSMVSLRSLNLSEAGFGGLIPPQLGNLSNLQHLNLRGVYKYNLLGKNLDWVSRHSSLEFLDLSLVDLSKSFDWLKVMNSLPSLVELHLSDCRLPGFSPLLHLNFSSLNVLDLSDNFLGGPIPNVLQNMTSFLRELDLSLNDFNSSIPNWLYGLSHLQHLNLRENILRGQISSDIGNLTSLISLDFSNNFYLEFAQGIPKSFKNLCSLRSLDLTSIQLNQEINYVLETLTSGCVSNGLEFLSLGSYNLSGHLTGHLGHFKNLKSLSLYGDGDSIYGPIPRSLGHLCNLQSLVLVSVRLGQEINDVLEILSSGCISHGLQVLYLWNCQLSGQLTDNLSHLKNVIRLDLSDNLIYGPIPLSLGEMTSLRYLELSMNKLNGTLPVSLGRLSKLEAVYISDNLISGPIPLSLGEMTSLRYLRLSMNKLNGTLPVSLGRLSKLEDLDISDNLISGAIPLSLGVMTSLRYLRLSMNKLNGTLPVSLGRISKLEDLFISDNLLEGEVSEIHFANLTKLSYFDASGMGKNIALRVSPNWIPPLQLQYFQLGSWNIGPEFPIWVRSLKYLVNLDLSNSGIISPIPNWFWDLNSQYVFVNFSHNQMHGLIPNISSFGDFDTVIDLSSNNFSGEVPFFSSNLSALDLSNNSFSGSISNFLCYNIHEVKDMEILNLGGNNLSGEIPDCWMSWKYLTVIKLSSNKFVGKIPNSVGAVSMLESLCLHDNNLSGVIPSSLANCTYLITLDLSENNFFGNIPTWVGERLSSLIILNFHANKFDGRIPMELCHVSSLHILDLADNSLSGEIPSCFYNFTAMATRNDSVGKLFFYNNGSRGNPFFESTLLVMKGNILEYSTNLGFVRSIDLSQNNLSGQIPKDITSLVGLNSLNLSQNALDGSIPENIGVMQSLESIDLSQNQLSGEIPESMSSMTFLSRLNLSYNKLFGKIPSSTQLQSFDPSSFCGNQLCGLPLTNNCSKEGSDDLSSTDSGRRTEGNGVDVDWFYVSMALGFVVGFWSAVGLLVIL